MLNLEPQMVVHLRTPGTIGVWGPGLRGLMRRRILQGPPAKLDESLAPYFGAYPGMVICALSECGHLANTRNMGAID